MTYRRDITGRLEVDDETLVANAIGCAIAASLSTKALMALLQCDEFEAEAFRLNAQCDLSRIQRIAGMA